MKKIRIILVFIMLLPFLGFTQNFEGIDFVSPFNEGLASIKKADQWAFINEKGEIVIDFRGDLVSEKIKNEMYPISKNSMILIQRVENNITYFGFADKTGKTVISPQYLKAKNFENNRSIVLILIKQKLGHNSLLNKPVVTYKYREVLIDKSGNVIRYLGLLMPFSMVKHNKIRPEIHSKIISKKLIVIEENGLFKLIKY